MLLYPSLDFANKFHIDHIYPKSKFKKNTLRKIGINEEKIEKYMETVNDISNLQLLPAQINTEKSDMDFDLWFGECNKTENSKIQYRLINYLPEIEYSYINYLEFMEKRKSILRGKLKEILL